MNILTCIFSYNRPDLLENCARSVDEFFPWGDRLILDDGSDHPSVDVVLNQYKAKEKWQAVKFDRDDIRQKNKRLGGFYLNIRYALEYALKNGYDYCFLLEEDAQFVWHYADYPNYVRKFFEATPDAIQLAPFFLERFTHFGDLEFVESANAYRTRRGFTTSAVVNLSVMRSMDHFEFFDATNQPFSSSYLTANSKFWLEKGYRFYWQRWPTVMRSLWLDRSPAQTHQVQTGGQPEQESGPASYLIEPFGEDEVERLLNTPVGVFPVREFFGNGLKNNGILSWQYKNDWARYIDRYSSLFLLLAKDKAYSPLSIRTVRSLEQSNLAPSKSNLHWKPSPPAEEGGLYSVLLQMFPRALKAFAKRALNSLPVSILRRPIGFSRVVRLHFVYWREREQFAQLTKSHS